MTRIPQEGPLSGPESASDPAETGPPSSAGEPATEGLAPPSPALGPSEAPSATRRHLIWLALLRIAVSFAMASSGRLALSDDDYARVSIAQRFAKAAHLDPSGTSWLPFPFWIMGSAMKVLDPSLEVARLVTQGLAVAATWLFYATARIWGLSEQRSLLFAAAATMVPAMALLGSVMVPELPTAALAVFSVAAATAPARRVPDRAPWFASAALFAATLSRYETWPIGVVVAVLLFRRVQGDALWRRALTSASALLGPAFWIAHNRWAHGDALSFLRRVAAYRTALGPAAVERWGYVVGLVGGSPGVMLVLTVLVVAALRDRSDGGARRDLRRFAGFALAGAALVGFLVVGQWMGGTPTHHPERALLFVWIAALLSIVDLAPRVRFSRWVVIPAALLLVTDYRATLRDEGAERAAEERVGTQLRSLVAKGERVFAATTDYGYFAVMAAFGRPDDVVFDSHDPRLKRDAMLLGDPWNAPQRLRAEDISWLVAPSNVVWPLALRERSRVGTLVIYELDRSR